MASTPEIKPTMTIKTLFQCFRKLSFVLDLVIVFSAIANATPYYSQGNLAPNLTSSWNSVAGGGGSTPSNFTTSGNVFIIQNGHSMTTTGTWTVSGTSSTIQISTGGTLVASNAVNATVMTVASGGTYQHNQNGGIIPTAIWDPASTCSITGNTSTVITGGYNQTFGNFTWNCASQSTYLAFAPSSMSIQGNLTVINTNPGSNNYDFAIEQNITVGGDLIISGGIFRISYNTNRTQTINGAVTISGGKLLMNSSDNTGTNYVGTINANGNVSITNGTLDLSQSSARTGDIGIINVKGNFSHTGGTITESGSSTASAINFAGTTQQTYTSGGTVSSLVNFTVNNGAILYLGTSLLGNGSAGTFTLANGGTLGIGDAAGITTTGTTGNIRVTGTRTYNAGANYIYNGTSAQAAGNGFPATVSNLTISNPAGLTLPSAKTVTNNLSITTGAFINLGTITTHSAGTLTLGGIGVADSSWGSTSSTATHQNNSYFASTSGIINVSSNLCALLTASATKTDISCFNANNGQIVVIGAGGSGTYEYSIYNGIPASNYQSSDTFTGLAAGQYKIRVRDTNTQCESIQIP